MIKIFRSKTLLFLISLSSLQFAQEINESSNAEEYENVSDAAAVPLVANPALTQEAESWLQEYSKMHHPSAPVHSRVLRIILALLILLAVNFFTIFLLLREKTPNLYLKSFLISICFSLPLFWLFSAVDTLSFFGLILILSLLQWANIIEIPYQIKGIGFYAVFFSFILIFTFLESMILRFIFPQLSGKRTFGYFFITNILLVIILMFLPL